MSDITSEPLKAGWVVKGPKRDYTVIKVLGQGGFGITYLVESTLKIDNIPVKARFALKEHFISSLSGRISNSQSITFMPTAAVEIEKSRRSFIKEANRLQELGISHHNVVRINEVFETNNTAYYVMEFLDGQTLDEYIKSHGPLSYDETRRILSPIADVLAFLHENKLTHYDVKPANIILEKTDSGEIRPVLIDFGLSKHYDTAGNATSTLSGGGYSPGYAPIEQYSGLKAFSPAADVYALGATFYTCLTGKHPAEAFDLQIDQVRTDLAGKAPESVIDALCKAMSMRSSDRWADARTFIHALEGAPTAPVKPVAPARPAAPVDPHATVIVEPAKPAQPGLPPLPPTPSQPIMPITPGPKKRTWLYVAIGVGALAIIVGILLMIMGSSSLDSLDSYSGEYDYVEDEATEESTEAEAPAFLPMGSDTEVYEDSTVYVDSVEYAEW